MRLTKLLVQTPFEDAGAIADGPGLSTRQLIFDYFAGEIFHKADVRAQQFLLHTAYLPEMTAGIARELSGDSATDELLASLTRNNYFVTLRETSFGTLRKANKKPWRVGWSSRIPRKSG